MDGKYGICLAALILATGASRADAPATVPVPAPGTAPAPAAIPIPPAKQAWLIGYCVETRFSSLAQVDSLTALSPEEKAFCKARLKLLNPLID